MYAQVINNVRTMLIHIFLYICKHPNTFMDEKDRLIIRINKDLKKKLKVIASKDGRSMSNYVIELIKQAIKNKK